MINAKEMVAAVRSLGMPVGQFAITGSAVLLAHGLLPLVRDVDIIAYGTAWDDVCASNTRRRAPKGDDLVTYRDGLIEVYNGWSSSGWRVQDLIAEADLIDGFRYVRLERILEYKKRDPKEHDEEHIALIEALFEKRKEAKERREKELGHDRGS